MITDIDAIKIAIEKLNKAWEPVAQKMYQATQAESSPMPSLDTLITDVYSEIPDSLKSDFQSFKDSKN